MAIHLGHRFPGGSSGVPGPSAGRVNGTCFALHRTGFGEPPCHHGSLVGSYPTVSPLPTPERRRSPLCATFRRLSPPGVSPASLPCGVRTFLGQGSVPKGQTPRPRPSGLQPNCTVSSRCVGCVSIPALRARPGCSPRDLRTTQSEGLPGRVRCPSRPARIRRSARSGLHERRGRRLPARRLRRRS